MFENGRLKWLAAMLVSMLLVTAAGAGDAEIGDPMRPSYLSTSSSTSVNRAPSWRVESIVVSPDRRIAVINGQSLAVGDRIQGARVMAIDAYAVTLDIDGKRRQLTLTDARIKTQAERK